MTVALPDADKSNGAILQLATTFSGAFPRPLVSVRARASGSNDSSAFLDAFVAL